MRQRYLDAFDIVRIDSLNGDKYRTGKLTPDGDPDPSVFSTEEDPVGIQVGTAIATLVRKGAHLERGTGRLARTVGRREVARVRGIVGIGAISALPTNRPDARSRPALRPGRRQRRLVRLAETGRSCSLRHFPGVKTARDAFLVDIDGVPLQARMADYFDDDVSHAEISRRNPIAMRDTSRFNAQQVRSALLARGRSAGAGFVRYSYRPFDDRWLYWDPDTKLLDEKRTEYVPHIFPGNLWFCAAQHTRKGASEPQAAFTRHIGSYHWIERATIWFPLYLRDEQFGEPVDGVKRVANLSETALRYIESLGAEPEDLFHHVLATLHEPSYREANAGGLRMGWPRIPLPDSASELAESADRGRLLARLLDTESDVTELLDTSIAVPTKTDGTQMQPADFNVSASWGHFGQNRAVMPGSGKVVRRGDVVDVYLNEVTYWADVPVEVWEYRLGGYQVLKKWLSYREQRVLGRGLEVSEVAWFSEVARRVCKMLGIARKRLRS